MSETLKNKEAGNKRNNDFKTENWKAYYINLDRRKDRKETVEKELRDNGIVAERFSALSDDDIIKFPNFHLGTARTGAPHSSDRKFMAASVKGERGCALSHYSILNNYASSKDDRILAIFEDDVHFCKDFKKRIDYLSANINFEWDIFWLGSACKLIKDKKNKIKHVWQIKDVIYGTHSLLINPKSINKILRLMEKFAPETSAIDNLYCYLIPYLKIYCFIPGMATQNNSIGDIGLRSGPGKSCYMQTFRDLYGEHVFSETIEEFYYKKTKKVYLIRRIAKKRIFNFLGKAGQTIKKYNPSVYKKIKPFFPDGS